MTPQQIIQALEKEGITRYRISQETGLSQTTLKRWYEETHKPDRDKLAKLIRYYESVIKN